MNRGDTCRITKTKRCCRLFLDKLYKTCLLGFQFGSPVGRRWTAWGSSYVHSTTVVSEASLLPLLWLHNKDIYDRFFLLLKVSNSLASVFLLEDWYVRSVFSEHASKHAHLLPGKSSWIIIFTFSKLSNTFAAHRPWELAWLCCLLVYEQHFFFLPSSLCSRSLFSVSGVRSRPDEPASSSPGAKTDFSYSPTEFTAAEEEFIKALLKNIKNDLINIFTVLPLGFICSCIIACAYEWSPTRKPVLCFFFSF